MYTYQLLPNGYILRSDGTTIPNDTDNSDYQTYLKWVSQGNTVTPVAPLTVAQTNAAFNATIQAQIDALELRQARPIREAALGNTTAVLRIKNIDIAVVNLRAQLK